MVSAAFPNRPFNLRDNVWFIQSDIANNRSLVGWELWIDKTSYSPTWSGGLAARWMRLNGSYVHEYYGSGFDFRADGPFRIANGSAWIPHNADGTKSLLIEAAADFDTLGATSLAVSVGLPTIPRYSKPSIPGGVELVPGTAYTLNMNRASSAFTHTVQYNFGTTGWVTIATGVGTSTSWTPPASLLNEIPNSIRGNGTIRTITFNGGTQIGYHDFTFYLNVPSSYVPTLTSVTAVEATAGLATNVGKFVQFLTTLDASVNGGAGVAGSTISSQKIEIFSGSSVTQTINAGTGVTAPLTASGTLKVRGTVTDSRGRSAYKEISISVLAYSPPAILSVGISRALSNGTVDIDEGTYLRVDINAVSTSLVNSTERNSLRYRILSRTYGSTTWTTKLDTTHTSIAFNSYKVVGTYSVTQSYEVRVEIIDDFSTSAVNYTVPVAEVFMHWNSSEGMGLGKFREQGRLDVAGDIYQNSNLVIDEETLYDNLAGLRVRVGSASATSVNQSGITTSMVEITGTSVSFTLDAPSIVIFSGTVSTYSNNASDVIQVAIRNGTNNLEVGTYPVNSSPTAQGTTRRQEMNGETLLPAGSHRLNIAIMRVVGPGSITVNKTTETPTRLTIDRVI